MKNGLTLFEKITLIFLIIFLLSVLIYVFNVFQHSSQEKPTCSIRYLVKKENKPSYELLKSRTVYITGCSGDIDVSEKLNVPIEIDEEGFCWGGTGVIVKITNKETYILTNNHVAGKAEKDAIIFVENNEQKIRAEIVKYHPYVDLAVIKIPTNLKNKTQIDKIGMINIQDPVYIVGHPLSNKYIYTEGVQAGYSGISDLIQAPCIYGNSGSGIWDKEGNLVGVVYALQLYPGWMGIPMPQITHTLAIDSISIQMFLEELELYNE